MDSPSPVPAESPALSEVEAERIATRLAFLLDSGLPLDVALQIEERSMLPGSPKDLLLLAGRSRTPEIPLLAALCAHARILPAILSKLHERGRFGATPVLIGRRLTSAWPAVALNLAIVSWIVVCVLFPSRAVLYDMQNAEPVWMGVLIWTTRMSANLWLMLPMLPLLLIAVPRALLMTTRGEGWLESWQMRFSPFAGLVRRAALARLSRLLGTLLAAGISPPLATGHARELLRCGLAAGVLDGIRIGAGLGDSTAKRLLSSGSFDDASRSLLETATDDAATGRALREIADRLDTEVRFSLPRRVALVRTVLILVSTLFMGLSASAVALPLCALLRGLMS